MATPNAPAPTALGTVPDSFVQVTKLARYQLREYLRSRRFVALVAIVAVIGAILTTVVAHFRGGIVSSPTAFYGSAWGGGISFLIVLSAVFFGGDAIAGEFQNKTGYFLMGLPLKRTTIYAGKYIAAYLASVAVMLVFLAILLGNGLFYFGASAFPWQWGVSLVLALVYLGAVLGATFLFSSLFKTSAYGFVLTAVLFIIGFGILQDVIVGLWGIEPWMIISYASSTISSVFDSPVNWGLSGSPPSPGPHGIILTPWTAGIAEGVVIMLVYLVICTTAGLFRFRSEEFT
jgi:ABC-2 type transport system permease protein